MTTAKVAIVISAAAFRSVNFSGPSVGLVERPTGFTCRHIGSTSCSILPSRMGDHGVCWENTENMEKMGNIKPELKINDSKRSIHDSKHSLCELDGSKHSTVWRLLKNSWYFTWRKWSWVSSRLENVKRLAQACLDSQSVWKYFFHLGFVHQCDQPVVHSHDCVSGPVRMIEHIWGIYGIYGGFSRRCENDKDRAFLLLQN